MVTSPCVKQCFYCVFDLVLPVEHSVILRSVSTHYLYSLPGCDTLWNRWPTLIDLLLARFGFENISAVLPSLFTAMCGWAPGTKSTGRYWQLFVATTYQLGKHAKPAILFQDLVICCYILDILFKDHDANKPENRHHLVLAVDPRRTAPQSDFFRKRKVAKVKVDPLMDCLPNINFL